MFPPTLASSGGRGLSLSFLRPLRFGLRALATWENLKSVDLRSSFKPIMHQHMISFFGAV